MNMQTQLVKIKDLKNNTGQINGLPKNPRILKDDKFIKLKKSLQDDPEMLELREVIAYDNNGELIVICGNMRLKALKELGIKEVPTKILPIETSVEKLKAYTIKDNVSFGDHDWDVLANEWDAEQLDAWGLDVPDFTAEEIEAEEDDFDTTPPEKPITVLGDLYEIGEHRLLCGDSTDSDEVAKLMNGQKADMVFTDPPYNLGEIIKGDTFITENKRLIENQSWDKGFKIEETVVIADVFTKKDASVYIFTSQYLFGDIVKKAKIFSQNIQFCVWIKKNPQPNMGKRYFTQSCELCVFYTKGKHIFNFTEEGHEYNFWEFNKEIHSTIHPTEKPVNIPSHAILKSSIQNSLVLDLFLGSGSTMVASHQLKRKCYGMELDCRYADVIVRRMLKLDPTLSLKRNGVDCKSEFQ